MINHYGAKPLQPPGARYGARFAPNRDNTWEAGSAATPELYSTRNAYPKVLKHRQLELFRFRTVTRSTGRGSLGMEMGKRLGKRAEEVGVTRYDSLAVFARLICLPLVWRFDYKQSPNPRNNHIHHISIS